MLGPEESKDQSSLWQPHVPEDRVIDDLLMNDSEFRDQLHECSQILED